MAQYTVQTVIIQYLLLTDVILHLIFRHSAASVVFCVQDRRQKSTANAFLKFDRKAYNDTPSPLILYSRFQDDQAQDFSVALRQETLRVRIFLFYEFSRIREISTNEIVATNKDIKTRRLHQLWKYTMLAARTPRASRPLL